MKTFVITAIIAMIGISASAQSSKKVTWKYSAKKIGDKVYEIHLTAIIAAGWQIYAQGIGGEKTSFFFNANPLATLDGKPKESKLIMSHKNYTADFVQKVKLKSNSATTISGNIRFTASNNFTNQLLPSSTVSFSIRIGD
jgi:hypothetical protein